MASYINTPSQLAGAGINSVKTGRSNLTQAIRAGGAWEGSISRDVGHGRRAPPSPPNSTSPNFPPHGKFGVAQDCVEYPQSPPEDFDLNEPADEQEDLRLSKGPLQLTPVSLANEVLPEILLGRGGSDVGEIMSIGTIMDKLRAIYPGLRDEPQTRLRRALDAALHLRATKPECDIIYDKPSWGKWRAHCVPHGAILPVSGTVAAIPTGASSCKQPRRSSTRDSWDFAASSASAPRSALHRRGTTSDYDMERMIIEGQEDNSSRYLGNYYTQAMAEDSETDEEDWAAIGAAELRARSHNAVGGGILPQYITSRSRGRDTRNSSAPVHARFRGQVHDVQAEFPTLENTDFDQGVDARSAAEVLMSMSRSQH